MAGNVVTINDSVAVLEFQSVLQVPQSPGLFLLAEVGDGLVLVESRGDDDGVAGLEQSLEPLLPSETDKEKALACFSLCSLGDNKSL